MHRSARLSLAFTTAVPTFAWPLPVCAFELCVFAVPAVFFARCALIDVTARARATRSATPATANGRPPRWIDAMNLCIR